ncbi:ATP-binding cassette domain-containing protein [Corynebacterium choanae]|uniref:Putative siderophore transport system ATP-binding protein YusV n=1 Tax=Corynebacterium choanae TaxID=1862358 RepID=A0A3G6J8F8_9CORY|nr:ABC transporter ATP-binding protein [Corynebacterium choanae]AZA14385.1 putative siderophore transport system ATP-binding protein YusV [Corynebacterium choanae]
MSRRPTRIKVRSLAAGGSSTTPAIAEINLTIPADSLTIIVGANSSGKSVLLAALGGRIRATRGSVVIDGTSVERLKRKDRSERIALVPQHPSAPEGMKISDLIAAARSPHSRFFIPYTPADEHTVAQALNVTGAGAYATADYDELAAHQRRRVWLAAALARNTPILLLDEPTHSLDLARTQEMMNLIHRRTREHHTTVVMTTRDLPMALRYADQLVILDEGRVAAAGAPSIITKELLAHVFHIDADIVTDPATGGPLIIPAAPPHIRIQQATHPSPAANNPASHPTDKQPTADAAGAHPASNPAQPHPATDTTGNTAAPTPPAQPTPEPAGATNIPTTARPSSTRIGGAAAPNSATSSNPTNNATNTASDSVTAAQQHVAACKATVEQCRKQLEECQHQAKQAATKARRLQAKAQKFETELDELDAADPQVDTLRALTAQALADAHSAQEEATALQEALTAAKEAVTDAEADVHQAKHALRHID